ncbi:hypothetical protein IKQ21_06530 [bacterium]|nr:hypothetical protein [bacterium]
MLNTIKDSFGLTNKYIILATPLILFSLISSLYIIFSANGNAISLLFALLLFFLMFGAFLSGWLFMVKKCIENREQDINSFISEFPAGVGEYFLPACGMIILSLIVAFFLTGLSYFAGIKLIGNMNETFLAIMNISASADALKSYLMTLPADTLIKINQWNLLIFATAIITYFLLMFYSPSLFFKSKNPFKALFLGLKDLFCRKFGKNILLFIIVFITYFLISILGTILGKNIFLHFIFTLVNFYFMVFAVVLVYNYYYKNYVQIGANIDTRI